MNLINLTYTILKRFKNLKRFKYFFDYHFIEYKKLSLYS